MAVPVIDLFAGPGGLGEGFSSLRASDGSALFKIRLSVEMDAYAHRTLLLRAFYRQFDPPNVPDCYYQYLRGEISLIQLERLFKDEAAVANEEAWQATLGKEDQDKVSRRISSALRSNTANWLLIGGPPCQAYSLVGRSRIIGQKGIAEYEKDHRHFLYREYLRIIARHRPAVFVMENVKGLLSASIRGKAIFPLIREDLQDPLRVFPELRSNSRRRELRYKLFSLVTARSLDADLKPGDFIVRAEEHGVPQTRHRVILLGIREHVDRFPNLLSRERAPSVKDVIADLPALRSRLSAQDNAAAWELAIRQLSTLRSDKPTHNGSLGAAIQQNLRNLKPKLETGGRFIACRTAPNAHSEWYVDRRLRGICNHESRGHIPEDLRRYFFSAVFAGISKPARSPVLKDFPRSLLPEHKNVAEALAGKKFGDRFRVQVGDSPSTTVVSHISKDGHYYIHYDPTQCRSLTVREAARLQTFPDNYFFEGPRTEQYKQVGNAVPPLLARQIAEIVAQLLNG